MALLSTCCRSLAALSRGAARAAASRLRAAVGGEAPDWRRRLSVCEACSLSVVDGGRLHCGRPFHSRPLRDEASEGCGCPCGPKARDPGEHCPIREVGVAAAVRDGVCDCRWCEARRHSERGAQRPEAHAA